MIQVIQGKRSPWRQRCCQPAEEEPKRPGRVSGRGGAPKTKAEPALWVEGQMHSRRDGCWGPTLSQTPHQGPPVD